MKSLRNPNRRPTHPGAILREDVLPALAMTQAEFADRLGISRLSVSQLLHEKRSMTPEMAARVGKLLNTTPEIVHRESGRLLESMRGTTGHIFNLGHGIMPHAKIECMTALVDTVTTWK